VTDGQSLAPIDRAPTLARLAAADERAHDYARASKAENTIRAYRRGWADFTAWCAAHGLPALPAEPRTVAYYLSGLGGVVKASTIQQRVSAIAQAHKTAGHASPTSDQAVRLVLQGIRRTHGTAQQGKAPAVVDDLRRMVAALPESTIGVRDRALLLLGFAGALRRSELVGLDVGDVRGTGDGLVVTIRRSKTDQEGQGREIGVPYGSTPATCPVRAVRAWLAVRAVEGPALFCRIDRHGAQHAGRLSDRAVALVVKRCAERAGLDPANYAGHSLRAGLATSAAAADVPERVIAQQTGHRSMVVLRRYIRSGSLFRENAAARVGL
jgi:site-specific recombinase XerD